MSTRISTDLLIKRISSSLGIVIVRIAINFHLLLTSLIFHVSCNVVSINTVDVRAVSFKHSLLSVDMGVCMYASRIFEAECLRN